MSTEEIKNYVTAHQYMGFDELAENLSIDKDQVKTIWNELNLGWKMFPRTLVDTTRLEHRRYRLLNEVKIYPAEGMLFVIPAGFIFDWASVPRWAWWFLSPDDNGLALPALLHDQLYASEFFDRPVCDALFLQAMRKQVLLPSWKRWIAYLAVRLGGGRPWKQHDQAEVRKERDRLLGSASKHEPVTMEAVQELTG